MEMTYGEFFKHMSNVVKVIDLQDQISGLCANAFKDRLDCEIVFPTLETNVVELLAKLTNDKSDLIGYWVYELDCGKEYHDGAVTEDGEDIKLKTINDLWCALRQEEKKRKNNVNNN